MKLYRTNLKYPLNANNGKLATIVSNFRQDFGYYGSRKLPDATAQNAIFGRNIADVGSLEADALMIIFFKERLKLPDLRYASKQHLDTFLKRSQEIKRKLLKHYQGRNSILKKMRRTRLALQILLALISIGIATLLVVRIINGLSVLCGPQPANEIVLIVGLGALMLYGLGLLIYDVAKGKELSDYNPGKKIEEHKLQKKFTAKVMNEPIILCIFYIVVLLVLPIDILYSVVHESIAENTLVATTSALAFVSLITIIASYCDIAVDCSKPNSKLDATIEEKADTRYRTQLY